MRFAWLRIKEGSDGTPSLSPAAWLVYFLYNLVWWVPAVLAIIGVISFRAGSIGFLAVTVLRALVNAYRINVMPVEAAHRFPLRSP